ncbi:MAG: DegT/DnrJ/EryC1/StrS aminotransferase family protein [Clostridia bacterium]|nr:DegT/DnrJ/EryC1/StrS aminotransferase family protein [Clostridia bacterium]
MKIEISKPLFFGDEGKYIQDALDKCQISYKGDNIDKMTTMLKDATDMPYALLLANGTAGIHLALKALDVSDSDIVFCPTLTYCGTIYPIIYERAIPVFIDCKEDGTMDEECLKKTFEKYKDNLPKCVMAVDTYGASFDYDAIREICDLYSVPLISDSAESLGGMYKDKKCGSYGDISVISFSYSKIVTTSMGGAVLTRNESFYEKMKYLANQAKAKSTAYIHKEVGYNYLMSNINAGLGVSQLKRLDFLLDRKREIFNTYKKGFSNLKGVKLISDKEGSSYWQNGIILENGKAEFVTDKMIEMGIEVRRGFNPMHTQEAFNSFDYITINNVSEDLFRKTVLLPSGNGTTNEELKFIIDSLTSIIGG